MSRRGSESGAWFPKQAVIAACQATVAGIKTRRQTLREEALAELLAPRRWPFRTRTQEEAEKCLAERDLFHRCWDYYCDGQLGVCTDLILFCKATDEDRVWVTLDAFDMFQGRYVNSAGRT